MVSVEKPISASDCSWCDRIRAGIAIALLEFFFRAHGSQVGHAIDAENAIQMIDFVLEQLGKISHVSGANLVGCALQVLVTNGDVPVAPDLHEDGQETKTGVPHHDVLGTAFDDFRIDQRPRLFARQPQEDDPLGHSDLRGGDASAGSVAPGQRCRSISGAGQRPASNHRPDAWGGASKSFDDTANLDLRKGASFGMISAAASAWDG